MSKNKSRKHASLTEYITLNQINDRFLQEKQNSRQAEVKVNMNNFGTQFI